MIEIVPFAPPHLTRLNYGHGFGMAASSAEALGRALEDGQLAYAGLYAGQVIGAAGIIEQSPGRALAWALFPGVPTPAWIRIVRFAGQVIARGQARFRRIEATCKADFGEAERLLTLLGFQREGRLAAYGPDGEDHLMYARIRQGGADV